MLTDKSPSSSPQPNNWQYILGLAENISRKEICETARLNAYHLKLGALAAMYDKRPCDLGIATIPHQIAKTTEAGAIIAQFVTAASLMAGTLQARSHLKTQAQEYIDAGVYGLKIFYSGQNGAAALYPRHDTILHVINRVVPECPQTACTIISTAIRNVRPK
ncbi:MAG: hypothetical protein WBK91_06395 [Alphaproteobacteria bacterium]